VFLLAGRRRLFLVRVLLAYPWHTAFPRDFARVYPDSPHLTVPKVSLVTDQLSCRCPCRFFLKQFVKDLSDGHTR
jgi:hypothetical protein